MFFIFKKFKRQHFAFHSNIQISLTIIIPCKNCIFYYFNFKIYLICIFVKAQRPKDIRSALSCLLRKFCFKINFKFPNTYLHYHVSRHYTLFKKLFFGFISTSLFHLPPVPFFIYLF